MIRTIVQDYYFYVFLILYAYSPIINYLYVGLLLMGLVEVKYRAMIVSIQFLYVKYA